MQSYTFQHFKAQFENIQQQRAKNCKWYFLPFYWQSAAVFKIVHFIVTGKMWVGLSHRLKSFVSHFACAIAYYSVLNYVNFYALNAHTLYFEFISIQTNTNTHTLFGWVFHVKFQIISKTIGVKQLTMLPRIYLYIYEKSLRFRIAIGVDIFVYVCLAMCWKMVQAKWVCV